MNERIDPQLLNIALPKTASDRQVKRKKLFIALAGGVAVAGAAFAGYETFVASRHVTTDNAYVDADSAQVNALTSGPVKEVRVVDTQAVRKGDVLVVIDDTDRRLELE